MPTLFLTGATGELAQAIRARYVAEGWRVAGFARKPDGFEHPAYRFWPMDATDEPSTETAFAHAAQELGKPRALIATVGGVRPWKPVEQTAAQDFRALFELNLLSFFLSAKHALPFMPDEGTIVSIGAEPALHPVAQRGAYSATKAGVIALTGVLAEEGKTRGVNAVSIVPTIIRTKANEEWGSPSDFEKWTKPEDIAALCFFLTDKPGNAVNGAVIRMPNSM